MDRMVMEFVITIDRDQISRMQAVNGKVTIIPFSGYTYSELFNGKILPGAADVQVTNAAGIRHMCARYMFEGKDFEGNPCHLFVDNNGYFEPGSEPSPFHACPVFMTDSAALSERLARNVYRAEGHPSANGVNIRIYEVSDQSVPVRNEEKEYHLSEAALTERLNMLEKYINGEDRRLREINQIAAGICADAKIVQATLFSGLDSGVYDYRDEHAGDPENAASMLYALYDTSSTLFFVVNDGTSDKMTGYFCNSGKIMEIPSDVYPIFKEMLDRYPDHQVWDRPFGTYPYYHLKTRRG